MSVNSGPCLGGPYDGKFMDHLDKTELELWQRQDKPLLPPIFLGLYKYEWGCWVWKPKAGAK